MVSEHRELNIISYFLALPQTEFARFSKHQLKCFSGELKSMQKRLVNHWNFPELSCEVRENNLYLTFWHCPKK